MKQKHPKITPHEPGQPIVGPKEAIEDIKTIDLLLAERTQQYVKAIARRTFTGERRMAMKTISLRLPDLLHETVRELAKREHVSINQFITLALAEKISALMTEARKEPERR